MSRCARPDACCSLQPELSTGYLHLACAYKSSWCCCWWSRTENLIELDLFVESHTYLLKHLNTEEIFYPNSFKDVKVGVVYDHPGVTHFDANNEMILAHVVCSIDDYRPRCHLSRQCGKWPHRCTWKETWWRQCLNQLTWVTSNICWRDIPQMQRHRCLTSRTCIRACWRCAVQQAPASLYVRRSRFPVNRISWS